MPCLRIVLYKNSENNKYEIKTRKIVQTQVKAISINLNYITEHAKSKNN